MRRLRLSITAAVFAATALAPGVASAHSQTVQPPGQDSPTVQGPISKPWAQAHCNAQAPFAVAASGGVVVFLPVGNFTSCPAPNPGGQVHPGSA